MLFLFPATVQHCSQPHLCFFWCHPSVPIQVNNFCEYAVGYSLVTAPLLASFLPGKRMSHPYTVFVLSVSFSCLWRAVACIKGDLLALAFAGWLLPPVVETGALVGSLLQYSWPAVGLLWILLQLWSSPHLGVEHINIWLKPLSIQASIVYSDWQRLSRVSIRGPSYHSFSMEGPVKGTSKPGTFCMHRRLCSTDP